MKAVDAYLYTLQEGLKDKIVKWLEDTGLRQATLCKRTIQSEPYIYLYHATRPQYVSSIKREGLTLSSFGKRAKKEGDITVGMQPMIYMTNVRTAKPGFGFRWSHKKHGLIHIICKVDTDSSILKWSTACCYYYMKDVPPSDLTFEGTREFEAIERGDKCLVQKDVGEI
jgi:hypothetical protein